MKKVPDELFSFSQLPTSLDEVRIFRYGVSSSGHWKVKEIIWFRVRQLTVFVMRCLYYCCWTMMILLGFEKKTLLKRGKYTFRTFPRLNFSLIRKNADSKRRKKEERKSQTWRVTQSENENTTHTDITSVIGRFEKESRRLEGQKESFYGDSTRKSYFSFPSSHGRSLDDRLTAYRSIFWIEDKRDGCLTNRRAPNV